MQRMGEGMPDQRADQLMPAGGLLTADSSTWAVRAAMKRTAPIVGPGGTASANS